MPLYSKTEQGEGQAPEESTSGPSQDLQIEPSSPEFWKIDGQSTAPDSDPTRRRNWGRRTFDKIKPILDKVVKVLSSNSINEAFFNVTEDIQGLLECESVHIYSVDRENNQLYSRNFVSDTVEEIRWEVSKDNLPGYVAFTKEPLLIADVHDSDEMAKFPGLSYDSSWDDKLKQATRSSMVVPIAQKGVLVGILQVSNKTNQKSFTDQELELVEEMARKMGSVLEKLEQEGSEEQIREIAVLIHRSSAMQEILADIQEPILKLFNNHFLTLYALDTSKNELYSKVKDHTANFEIRAPLSTESLCGWVAMEKRMINIKDVYEDEQLKQYHPDLLFDKSWDQKSGLKTISMLACPLIYESKVYGVLQLINKKNKDGFNEKDEKHIVAIAELLAIAMHNQKKFAQAKPSKFSKLLNDDVISMDELNGAILKARNHKINIEHILLDELKVTREQLGKSCEEFYKVPYVGFDHTVLLPKDCFAGLNKNFLIKNHWVPIERNENKIVVLTDNPTNHEKLQNIKQIFPKKEVEFRIGLRADIIDYITSSDMGLGGSTPATESSSESQDDVEPPQEAVESLLTALKQEQEEGMTAVEEDDDTSSAISDSDSTIVRLVNKIIMDAYDSGVSDIHIEPGLGKGNMLVRFRKDGECDLYQEVPNMYKRAFISRIKIISKLDIAEKRLPQDGKIKMKYGKKEIELRVATCPTVGGNEDVVMRILAASKPIPLDNMNFAPRNLELLKKQIVKPYGFILVVGPTGSGKTTTLHSALSYINTPKKKIWTAEDPVEITQFGLRQVQMHAKIGLDFARAMRSFLRGDPDVIMVGEMRDQETCAIGLEASLTGHLVFSTLHTNSAPETITRLLDMGMNPINFADALLLIVAQRLVKTLCKNCKEDYHPDKTEYDQLVEEYGPEEFARLNIPYTDDLMLKKPVGCDKCNQSGYAGRTGLHELLEGTADIKRMIMQKQLVEVLRNQAVKDGMTTLKQDGILKIFTGYCDLKQVMTVAIT